VNRPILLPHNPRLPSSSLYLQSLLLLFSVYRLLLGVKNFSKSLRDS
jgi:hypothetical protein